MNVLMRVVYPYSNSQKIDFRTNVLGDLNASGSRDVNRCRVHQDSPVMSEMGIIVHLVNIVA